jgi:MFS family permease
VLQLGSDFTIVARLSLYCEGQVDRNLIQSMSSVGSVVGLLVVNFYSDTQGKKKAMLMTLLIGMFSTARKSWSNQSLLQERPCKLSGYSSLLSS